MNLWKCQWAGCEATAVGLHEASGLRAIGWYFEPCPASTIPGPVLFCPDHHPDGRLVADRVSLVYQGYLDFITERSRKFKLMTSDDLNLKRRTS